MDEIPWYSHFPLPRSKPQSITHDAVAKLIRDPEKAAGKDYIIVDVRRTDFDTYMVRSAINIPAHAFYPTRMNLVKVFGNIPFVIFYCSSSNGRGPRCAAWFQDTLDEVGNKDSAALVLAGGIKNWIEHHSDLAEPLRHFPA